MTGLETELPENGGPLPDSLLPDSDEAAHRESADFILVVPRANLAECRNKFLASELLDAKRAEMEQVLQILSIASRPVIEVELLNLTSDEFEQITQLMPEKT